jgi:two-component system, NarL family, sensor histidine kinase UhpB
MSDPSLVETLLPQGLFRALIDQSPIMLWVADSEGALSFASHAWLSFSGRTMEDELGSGWTSGVHPDDAMAVLTEFREAIRSRTPIALEYRARRADGVYRWISSFGLPSFDADGDYLGHVGTYVDITGAKESDSGSIEEPQQLRRLIENAHDMVYRTRLYPTWAVEYCGGAVLAITGHTVAEFYADPELPRKTVHEDDRPLVWGLRDDSGHLQPVITLRWIHPDGRVVYAEHRRVPVYNAAGQIIAVEGIARDVTEFMESQRRLRESEDQLHQLAARLQDARETERAQVARELHDELGQTLTALKLDISRTVQALIAERITPTIIDRLQSLIGLSDIALATVKRIASTLRPPTLDHLGLAEAIHWEALAFKARTGLRCNVKANKTDTRLTAEQQTGLFRILQEALTNVVRHAQASAVQVTLTERNERFEMRIQDNGRGITEAQVADPAAIGLLGMRERAALIGGIFQITGHRGKGTIVSIHVPMTREPLPVRKPGRQKVRHTAR